MAIETIRTNEVGLLSPDDTIAAIATAPGCSTRGVVRVSGQNTFDIYKQLFQPLQTHQPSQHPASQACSGHMSLPPPLGSVPCELFLWRTKRSFTQQPTAEFHLVGSPAILQSALREVCKVGARMAQPGEFTMRAFLAGRIDLPQAEAVLGVIDAEDQKQLTVALQQLAGGLSQPLAQLRSTLLDLCADLEAGLDFADEDIEFISADAVCDRLRDGQLVIRNVLEQISYRGELRDAPRVVLRGAPNVGKSTLWNAITRKSAIVSDVAGTTRDYLRASVEHHGVTFELIDTAGVFEDQQLTTVDQMATITSDKQAEVAHVVVLCLDATTEQTAWERRQLEQASRRDWIVVDNKSDAVEGRDRNVGIATSGLTGLGIDELLSAISAAVQASTHDAAGVAGTAARCNDSLQKAAECLSRADKIMASGAGEELAAAEIRSALDELGRVVGTIYTDDILDRVFSRFCIGK